MPYNRRRFAAGVLTLAVVLGAGACADDSAGTSGSTSPSGTDAKVPDGTFAGKKATGSAIKVGFVNPEGGTGVSQPELRLAASAVVKYANENLGGLAGHTIDLVLCKTQEDAATAIDCANQMIEQKVVAVVVGNSGQGAVMAPIIQKAKIPYVSYNGASPQELTAKDYSYAWTGGFAGTLNGMASYAGSKGMKNVSLYVLDVPAVTNGASAMGNPAFQAAGVTLNVVPVPPGTPDATSQVQAGLKANPEGIGIVGDSTVCIAVLKALTTLGTTAARMVNQSCVDPSVFQAVGNGLDGAKVMATSDGSSDDPEAVAYRAILTKYAPDLSQTGQALAGYQSMLGFLRAAAGVDAADVTAATVNAAIRSAKDVPVPVGHGATMTCDGSVVPNLPMLCNDSAVVQTISGNTIGDVQLQN